MSAHSSSRLLIALLALTLACGGSASLAPGIPGNTYALQRVANDRLPAVVATNDYGTIYVFSETLRLDAGGTGTLGGVSEMVPHRADLPREGPVAGETEITWTRFRGGIAITTVCPPNANCVAGPHLIAQVKGQTLKATWGPQLNGRDPLYYLEVPGEP